MSIRCTNISYQLFGADLEERLYTLISVSQTVITILLHSDIILIMVRYDDTFALRNALS